MTQIGRYRVIEELGRGAMGTVYRALDPTIGRTVAIKAIRLSEFVDSDERERVRKRLLQEAQAAGLLSHPNIITIFDVLEEGDGAYIVMEYVSGPSLGTMLRTGALPERERLLEYFRQVADALDHAHRKGVIHRDIKSANIIISSEEGRADLAKVSDFGISKFISQDTTHSGTMIGTPSYMSPEQIQGLILDGRSDQFSFAVVVYEMLTGAKPFSSDVLATLFYQICKQDPLEPEKLNSTLDPSVGTVLKRALEKDPGDRFASCAEFINSLAQRLQTSDEWAAAAMARAAAVGAVVVKPASSRTSSFGTTDDHQQSAEPVLLDAQRTEHELPPLAPRERAPHESGTKLAWIAAGLFVAIIAVVFLIVRSQRRINEIPAAASSTNTETTPSSVPEATRSDNSSKPSKRVLASPSKPSQAANPPGSPPAVGPSQIELLSQPPGARVVIDERTENTCQTPCTVALSPGRHTLTAELKGFSTAKRIFNAPEERSVFLALSQSMGVLVVTSEPSGSTVIVDGKEYGRTPATLRLSAGTHQLALVNGAGRHEEEVVIQSDQFATRSFRWE